VTHKHRLPCVNFLLFLSGFKSTLIFLTSFSKKKRLFNLKVLYGAYTPYIDASPLKCSHFRHKESLFCTDVVQNVMEEEYLVTNISF